MVGVGEADECDDSGDDKSGDDSGDDKSGDDSGDDKSGYCDYNSVYNMQTTIPKNQLRYENSIKTSSAIRTTRPHHPHNF